MDLTDRSYSLQPHLIPTVGASTLTAGGSQAAAPTETLAAFAASTSPSPSPPRHHHHRRPVAPDSYVGMRLAANSSSSESIDLASRNPTPPPSLTTADSPGQQRTQQQQAAAFRFAPGEFHHPADDLPLTDISLDVVGGAAAAAASFDGGDAGGGELEESGDLDSTVLATGGVGLINQSVVADIANDIRDIKRAIAMQKRPLPSVIPQQHARTTENNGSGGTDNGVGQTDDGAGVWIRMPGSQAPAQPASQLPVNPNPAAQHHHHQQQQQQRLYEHRHPFYESGAGSNGGCGLGGNPFTCPSLEAPSPPSAGPLQQQQQQPQQPYQPQQHQQWNNGHHATDGGHLVQQQQRQLGAAADERPADYDSDVDTDGLMTKQYTSTSAERRVEIPELTAADRRGFDETRKDRGREVAVRHPDQPTVLIEGLLFRALYLGSTQLVTEGQPSKSTRMTQAQEAVGRIKAPDGENQPCVPVDLFISTEKIMVLNTNLQEIMMDHALKTISYIADIGNILVLMARRRFLQQNERRQTKIVCHVFETDEAQLVAQSIGRAFQVAYMEFLRANGIEDPGYQLRDMDYQDVLNQQDIIGEELALFSRRDMQKEVLVPKAKGEPLGVVIVESGWGSMLPTVVLANMQPSGPAARCGQLNIGDQLLSINGVSLVGLPLANCQQHVKACKAGTAVKVTLVSCPPVVEVLIRRPDVKFQLGFSVQNGVICSLLRGGIAERGGVRVGHRIIEINGQSVVATPHDRIVAMLASGVGEIHMKTMPTSIFRLLTGQEVPHYI